MQRDLERVLEIAILSAAVSVAAQACSSDTSPTGGGGSAGCPAISAGSQAGCPAVSAGGSQAGCPAVGGSAGCPAVSTSVAGEAGQSDSAGGGA